MHTQLILLFILVLSPLAYGNECSLDNVKKTWQQNKEIAISDAGSIHDFDSRIQGFLDLYQDSEEKFLFPLIALHGAKWADGYFSKAELTIRLMRLNLVSILFNRTLKKIERLATGLKIINREVYIDVVSKYRTFMDLPHCSKAFIKLGIPEKLVTKLSQMHKKKSLTKAEKLELYSEALKYEQNINVAPKIKLLAKSLKLSRLEQKLFLKPTVRFPYFPRSRKFRFKNFFDTQERIKYATEAAIIGLEAGERRVYHSL